MVNSIKKNLSKISIWDLLGVFVFLLLLIPSLIVRLINKLMGKRVWLVCEHRTARDNGYVFYKYLKENHPEINSYYAMKKSGIDYEKVKNYGNILQWGSISHYFIYMTAEWNISSHKNGNPNELLFLLLQRGFGLYGNMIFLQHGVLYQDFSMFHKKNCNFKLFICGAKPEYEFVNKYFGYKDEVKYTGLARFDQLYNKTPDNKTILYIPTWRRWLDDEEKFLSSEYFSRIEDVLNDSELDKLLIKENKQLYFYPHFAFWKYSHLFSTNNKNIKILDPRETDIQQLLMTCSLLITDYSSIATDFSYMKKPIIYYQFDFIDYYEKHCQTEKNNNTAKPYFKFEKDGFGPVVHEKQELLKVIAKLLETKFSLDPIYQKRIDSFFELHDNHNCDRIYNEISKLRNQD